MNPSRIDDPSMGSFILTELRDLRKSMEGRDTDIRTEITAVRDGMATLAMTLRESVNEQKIDRKTQDNLTTKINAIEAEVKKLKDEKKIELASWNGPKKMITMILGAGALSTALLTILKFLGAALPL